MSDTSWPIRRLLIGAVCVFLLAGSLFFSASSSLQAAAGEPANGENLSSVVAQAEALKAYLETGDLERSAQAFGAVKKWWSSSKAAVKQDSLQLALEIDNEVAGLSLALLNKDAGKAQELAATLHFSLLNYRDGAYADNEGKTRMTLDAYILKLRAAGDLIGREQWTEASAQVKHLQQQWLSVEGDIVSRSQTVYNASERDLVLLDAYLNSEDKRPQAKAIVDRMIEALTPLTGASYSWWDAALIPVREGMEGLLVVGALLMYANKAGSAAARRWVIGGSAAGVILCIGAGFAVAFLLSSGAFGRNNALINGWTGVLASVLLLYVSYWLHRNSDVKRWNQYLSAKSSQAISGGRMASLALLALFAIVREGLETVIFLIGMAGKMSGGELAAGITAGFGVLAACAFVVIKAGTRLPVRPVFTVSSVIVFYLCFKFMGSGIHSLQMAGLLPTTMQDYLPELLSISLYPSWVSTLPQLLLVAAGLIALLVQRLTRKQNGSLTIS
ncbi:FTR1 family protein [Paenibacillus filicis]|uniref:FTR1 family protein n=1 Tax=Paenibacillus filicis TaxID=669464 RepID=A0ABU9DUU5_9BACL